MRVVDLAMQEIATFGTREWIIVAIWMTVYFAPTIVAIFKKNPRKVFILALNVFLGWSGLGWLVLMLWAVFGDKLMPNFNPPSEK